MPSADALTNKEILTTWGNPPFLQKINRKYPVFTSKDLDSFFFLFFDNMASLIGILAAMIDISKICLKCVRGDRVGWGWGGRVGQWAGARDWHASVRPRAVPLS